MKKIFSPHNFIPLLAALLLGFAGIEIVKIFMRTADFSNLFNISIGLMGLWIGWRSNKVTIASAQDAKELSINEKIDAVEKECLERDRQLQLMSEKRDRDHEQEMALIQRTLTAIETQLEVKEAFYRQLITEMFNTRQELESYKAELAVATRFGDFTYRQERMQRELRAIKAFLQLKHQVNLAKTKSNTVGGEAGSAYA